MEILPRITAADRLIPSLCFLSKDNSLVLTLQYSKTELKAPPQTEMPQLPPTQWRDRAVPRVSISSEILSFSEE